MLGGALDQIGVHAAHEARANLGNFIGVLRIAQIMSCLGHGIDKRLGPFAVFIDGVGLTVHAGAEADIAAAANHQDRSLNLIQGLGHVRLPGDNRLHTTGIQRRNKARRAHIDALDVVLGHAGSFQKLLQVQIAGGAESNADSLALQIRNRFDAGAGPGNDAHIAVTGRRGEVTAEIADDAAQFDAFFQGNRKIGERGGGKIDLTGAQGFGQRRAGVADNNLGVEAVLGEEALILGHEYDHTAHITGGADFNLGCLGGDPAGSQRKHRGRSHA